MKVYLVLQYIGDKNKVIDAYASETHAAKRAIKLSDKSCKENVTYHVIKKSVKGLSGIKFEFDGRKRYVKLYSTKKRGKKQ